MELRPDINDVMARITRFATNGKMGDALVMINLRQDAYKVKGLDKWQFPRQMQEFLDEHIKALEAGWKGRVKERIDDDFIPAMFPRYGIAEHSAFVAGKVDFSENTSWPHPVLHDYSDVPELKLDPENTWLKLVVDGLRYLRERGDRRFAVKLRGAMSPLDLANALRGNDIFTDFYDYPEGLHNLLQFCTEAAEWFISRQKQVVSDFYGGSISGTDIWMPGNSIGHLSEDATVLCSSDVYKEFGQPYTEKLVDNYDTGFMHLHTAGVHAFKTILSTEKLRFFELAPDPNQPRGIDVYQEMFDLFQNKVMKLFVTLDEIKNNIDFLKKAKTALFCDAGSVEEAKAITTFVRRELPVL